MLNGKTPEQDMAEKLLAYRAMDGWSLENEAMFVENFGNKMVDHLTKVDGHPRDAAEARVSRFLDETARIMRESCAT